MLHQYTPNYKVITGNEYDYRLEKKLFLSLFLYHIIIFIDFIYMCILILNFMYHIFYIEDNLFYFDVQ